MTRSLCATAALVLALLASCAPETKPPVRVMALVRAAGDSSSPGGYYQATQVEIRTLSDAVAMKGSVATLVGGARIRVDGNDPLLLTNGGALTDEQLAKVFLKNEGSEPRASYIEKDGVLWPADFHTWNMVTSYYNLELAFDYFQAMGVPGATLAGVRVFYFPSFVLAELSPNDIKDNAMYFTPVKSFMVLPFDELQKAPLAINAGVMAHEYSHLVFSRLVYDDAALPLTLTRWANGGLRLQPNLLKSLDEGLADYHAFGASCRSAFGCDTRLLSTSFEESLVDERDFARDDLCLTDGLFNGLHTLGVNEFTGLGMHYQVGSVLAAALWRAGENAGQHDAMARAVLAAYDDASPQKPGLRQVTNGNLETPDNFTLEAVGEIFLSHITHDGLREETCNEFLGRLKMDRSQLWSCPASSVPITACAGR
ncbi:MAG: hypothetical protein WBV82_06500 [Myxococcaceae bacterium]